MAAKKGTKRASGSKSGKAQEVLLTIVGSGPAVATFEAMLAANQANGLMYAHAVHQQQITNILGMTTTVKSIHYMLDPDADAPAEKKSPERKKR